MIDAEALMLFSLAAFILLITPGPAVLYIVKLLHESRQIAHGNGVYRPRRCHRSGASVMLLGRRPHPVTLPPSREVPTARHNEDTPLADGKALIKQNAVWV